MVKLLQCKVLPCQIRDCNDSSTPQSASTKQYRYNARLNRTSAFRSQSDFGSQAKDIFLSFLDMFSLNAGQDHDKLEMEEVVRSLFSPGKEFFNICVYCALCFLFKLLQDVIYLYDIITSEDASFANMDERTKRNKTAKFLLWV